MCFFLPGLQMILCKPAQFKYLFSTSYAFLSIYEQSVLFYSLLYIFCSLFFRHCLSYIIHWYIIHRLMIFCLFLQPRLRLLIESLLARNRIQMFLPFLSRYIMNRYRHNLRILFNSSDTSVLTFSASAAFSSRLRPGYIDIAMCGMIFLLCTNSTLPKYPRFPRASAADTRRHCGYMNQQSFSAGSDL